MKNLIGISGYARSGKDTSANMLIEKLSKKGITAYKYSFAQYIKESMGFLCGFKPQDLDGKTKEVSRLIEMDLMFFIMILNDLTGTGFIEEDDQFTLINKWIQILEDHNLVKDQDHNSDILYVESSPRKIFQLFGTEFARDNICQDIWLRMAEMNMEDGCVMIIPDVRFLNEAEWIKSNNGIIISVSRDSRENIGVAHSSEKSIEEIEFHRSDHVVFNDRDMDYLSKMLDEVINTEFQ